MSVHIEVDISDPDDHLRQLEREPDAATTARLNAVHTGLFQETQRVVHVITGSLKGSGKIDADTDRHTWTGTITYGGASPGRIHDPVRYAQFEQARGDLHDFMGPIYSAHEGYISAIKAAMRDAS